MSRKLTINIENIKPKAGDVFGYQISNDGELLSFADGVGWDKTFVTEGTTQDDLNYIGRFENDLTLDNIYNSFNGDVLGVATQTDDKLVVVGSFTEYNGQAAPRICRLNTDGTLDNTFNIGSGANGIIRAVTRGSGNEIYIGGDFTVFNGVLVNRICRLNSAGTVNMTFVANVMSAGTNKGFNNQVSVLAYSGGGFFVGGKFTVFNGILNQRIIRLNTNGTIDTSFNVGDTVNNGFTRTSGDVNTEVRTFWFDNSNTRLYVGGNFNKYKNTTNCNNIVKLQLNGTLDPTFLQGTSGTGTNGTVETIRTDSSDNIYIGGTFSFYGVVPRAGLIKTTNTGILIDLFGSSFNMGGSVNDIRIVDDKLVVAGSMVGYNGTICGNLVTLDIATGGIEEQRRLNSSIEQLVLMTGHIIAVGRFTQINVTSAGSSTFLTIPLAPDLGVDFGAGFNGDVYKIFKNPLEDNYIVIGEFTTYKGLSANKVAKIAPDGTLVDAFTGSSSILFSNRATVTSDGGLIFGGNFTINDLVLSTVGYIARFNNDLTLDTSFNSTETGFTIGFPTFVDTIGDKILIKTGNQYEYNGVLVDIGSSVENAFIIENDGSYVENIFTNSSVQNISQFPNGDYISFSVNDGIVDSVQRIGEISFDIDLDAQSGVILDNGNIVLTGNFNVPFSSDNAIEVQYGLPSNTFAVISADGSQLLYNNTGSGLATIPIIKQHNNKIYVYSTSTATGDYNGTPVSVRLFRLNEDLTLDTTFNSISLGLSIAGGISYVKDLLFRPDNIVVVGTFVSLNGSTADAIAVIDYEGNVLTSIQDIAQTTQNVYDNLVAFNDNADIEYSINDNNVIFEYTFENDEIVVEEIYDTPEYVELTYTNESITIDELIEEIVVRSPYLIISNAPDFDTVEYNIKVYEGSVFNYETEPVLYSITKQKLIGTQENVYININNLVRERLECEPTTFLNTSVTEAQPIDSNISKWVYVDEIFYLNGEEVDTARRLYYAVDGYLYNTEENVLPKVLINGDRRYTHNKQSQRIYFQSNGLISITKSINYGGTDSFDVNIPFTENLSLDNTLYLQSIKLNNFNDGIKYISFTFDYEDSEPIIVRFDFYNDCEYLYYNLVYKNKWGVLESLPLSRKSSKTLNIKSEEFKRSIVDVNGSYNINRHTNKQFNTNGTEELVLNTNWIPEYMNQAIEEAMLSEELWLIDENNIITPVVRKDNNISYKTQLNDKLIQYTIKVEQSHSTIKTIL